MLSRKVFLWVRMESNVSVDSEMSDLWMTFKQAEKRRKLVGELQNYKFKMSKLHLSIVLVSWHFLCDISKLKIGG